MDRWQAPVAQMAEAPVSKAGIGAGSSPAGGITLRKESTLADRQTLILLRVHWDPETQDHPLGWDYESMLATDVEVVEFVEPESTFDSLLSSGRKER